MARTKTDRRSYIAGEKGRNRVRTFACPKTGMMQIEWREGGRKLSTSLKHRDFEKAKRQADQFAANYVAPTDDTRAEAPPEPLTLGRLFEMYLGEKSPKKSARAQKRDAVQSWMFKKYFGAERVVTTLSLRDWERFIQDRAAGRVGPGMGPWKAVGDRTVEMDLRFILAVFNWATLAGDGRGSVLLERNPFRGYKPPKEKNPVRVVLTEEEYGSLLVVSAKVDWRFHVALVLAHETGHRIGAIRELRWSDISMDEGLIRWRAEHEKNGYEHVTPMNEQARSALEVARQYCAGIGEAYVLPSPKAPTQPVSRYLVTKWWKKAERRAGLEPKPGRGWHSLRRKFASDLKEVPLKTLCQLGGWKSHVTVLMCYQRADEGEMREALKARRRARTAGMNGGNRSVPESEMPRPKP